ncbi:spermidine synthase [Myceligenerans xiligouense]|uniref:Methyltransferase family protein n=1 Tax=Myceligenerans xiligouense TaxID=253184 RepID=A0A3N4Z871_9MICO|nr:fused MFS/spermidine synthase [Myceligenerans xiligouense]RPF22058.1 methyltransferase family protein [Myceligenerans xiligouense]
MARRKTHPARRTPSNTGTLTFPTGPVPISTGTAEVIRDPDRPDHVTLHVNGVPSSSLDLGDPGFLDFEYMQQMAAVVGLLPAGPLRVLHLGAAGSALARYVEHERPGSRQLGVDLDARLIELVREWFALPRAPRLRLRADDAGRALAGVHPESFDVVIRDVFAGDATPGHLVGTRFAHTARRALRPGGVLLLNCADRPPLTVTRQELASLAEVFGPSAAVSGRLAAVAEPAILKGRRYGNVVLAAVRSGPGHTDLRDPALGRALRTLAVPATLLAGEDATRLAGTAPPLATAPDPTAPDPAAPAHG